uniref:Uncharacterized protein n=1 Tax=Zooxanthella nutricula TaxID=1333877 RepID=A0A7S2QAH7_9DINO
MSDGVGSVDVIIENVRLNDYHYEEDRFLVGYAVPGNYDCHAWGVGCCFCKPNGVRSSQVGVWVPATRNAEGTRRLTVRNVVASSTQADGINLHGRVRYALVENTYFQNAGDDIYALWGAKLDPEAVVFRNLVAINPGVLRPNWYGNCVATYGLKEVAFENITCVSPTLPNQIAFPDNGGIHCSTSMYTFHSSFSASYPPGHIIKIKGWSFKNLARVPYHRRGGVVGKQEPSKMVWSRSANGVVVPFETDGSQQLNVQATP